MHNCSLCDCSYKHLQGLDKHIRTKHPEMNKRRGKRNEVEIEEESSDELENEENFKKLAISSKNLIDSNKVPNSISYRLIFHILNYRIRYHRPFF